MCRITVDWPLIFFLSEGGSCGCGGGARSILDEHLQHAHVGLRLGQQQRGSSCRLRSCPPLLCCCVTASQVKESERCKHTRRQIKKRRKSLVSGSGTGGRLKAHWHTLWRGESECKEEEEKERKRSCVA